MKKAVLAALLSCAACQPGDAPSEKLADKAEALVDPGGKGEPLATGRYAPRDACENIEGASAFRQQLIEAVQLRDFDAFAVLTAPDVKLDFGGGAGLAELRKRLPGPGAELWTDLEQALSLGCAPGEQGGIVMPWVFAQDLGGREPYAAMLVTGEKVPVLAEPRTSAQRLGEISWDFVDAVSFVPERAFQQVRVGEGTTAYIATEKLRSLLDYRLLASARNGKWSVTSIVAGD